MDFRDKKVLILGLGINQGGVGAARFFAKEGAIVRVTDLKSKEELQSSLDQLKEFDITYSLGEHKLEDIDWADLILRNPALKPDNKYLQYALQKGKQVEMDLGIFLQLVSPNQVIGVTGTKGKSTTSSLIYEILSKHFGAPEDEERRHLHAQLDGRSGPATAGRRVTSPSMKVSSDLQSPEFHTIIFAGNIGKSMFDSLPFIREDSLVLLELSSFQLQASEQHKISPTYSLITNIYPDHLNYHSSMEEYIRMKRSIMAYQNENGVAFLRKGDQITDTLEFKKDLKGKIITFSKDDLPKDFQPKLAGDHNKENIAAALALVKEFGVDEKRALEIAQNFTGVEFRLQLIYDKEAKIYNDSAATTPIASIQALESLPGSIVIAGGMNKGLDYTDFTKALEKNAKEVYFLEGEATDLILSSLRSGPAVAERRSDLQIYGPYQDLEQLLAKVRENTQQGDIILFSPGATSFNLFQNEFDRGRKFNEAVRKVFGQGKL